MSAARFRIKKLKTVPVPARPWCIADREHPHWIGRAATHVEALSVAADRVTPLPVVVHLRPRAMASHA